MNAVPRGASVQIRDSDSADSRAIEALYPLAFPQEDLLPLVHDLLDDSENTISLVAVVCSEIAGNIIFTRGSLDGGKVPAALLAPLAVRPEFQKQGLGSALVRAGLERLQGHGIQVVYVLGDPAYYARFGFTPERLVRPPCPVPPEWADAWQSRRLGEVSPRFRGALQLPDIWLEPAFWSP